MQAQITTHPNWIKTSTSLPHSFTLQQLQTFQLPQLVRLSGGLFSGVSECRIYLDCINPTPANTLIPLTSQLLSILPESHLDPLTNSSSLNILSISSLENSNFYSSQQPSSMHPLLRMIPRSRHRDPRTLCSSPHPPRPRSSKGPKFAPDAATSTLAVTTILMLLVLLPLLLPW